MIIRGLSLYLFLSLVTIVVGGGAWAETGEVPGETVAASMTAPAATDAASTEAPKPQPASGAARPRTSDALIRALMVISSAGGNRPFPLVPR